MSSIPIRAAYEHHGAARRPCPQCGAGPNRWCVNTTGRLRRVPCVLRVHSGTPPRQCPETKPHYWLSRSS
jgi:hypothetical protein